MLLNNQQITEEIKKEIKIRIETNENFSNEKYNNQNKNPGLIQEKNGWNRGRNP